MNTVFRILLLVGIFSIFLSNAVYSIAYSDSGGDVNLIIENKCVDLDLENVALLKEIANCKQEKELQSLTLQSLRDKINHLDDLNQTIKNLKDQTSELREENANLMEVNIKSYGRSQSVISKAKGTISHLSQIFIRAYWERRNLLTSIHDLEAERAALHVNNENLMKLNAQLATDRQLAISKADGLVEQQAHVLAQLDAQKMELLKAVHNLEREKAALKADNEKLVKFNTQLATDLQLAISKAEGLVKQQAQVLAQADAQKEDLLTAVHDLEKEKAALTADNEKLGKLNAQLVTDRQLAIGKAKELVSRHAELIIRRYPRRSDSVKVVNNLEANISSLKVENARILKLNAQLESKGKEFFLKANECAYAVKGYDGLSQATKGLNDEVVMLKQENSSLKSKLDSITKGFNTEKASIYREVGATCAQAGLIEQAINAYQSSLKLEPDDPMTHYYLGLLYSKKRLDNDAVAHFKKYITLAPLADNREEVEYFMSNLLGKAKLVVK